MKKYNSKLKAFTLVELAIVLVVIGLLTAGVVGAQSLIRTSELNSVVADTTKFKTVISAFKLEYDALPGDMRDASSYWPSALNGNGDKVITLHSSEPFYLWVHLVNAGLMQGNYTGTSTSPFFHIIGENCPVSKIKGAGYGIGNYTSAAASWYQAAASNPHSIVFGAQDTTSTYEPLAPIISNKEAYSIDKKIDDGAPGLGNVTTRKPATWGNDCSTSTDPTVATYKLSTTTAKACSLTFNLGF